MHIYAKSLKKGKMPGKNEIEKIKKLAKKINGLNKTSHVQKYAENQRKI